MKKSNVSVSILVLVVLALIVSLVIWSVFTVAADNLSPEGGTLHTIGCKMNNALASYGLLRAVGVHFPKVLCNPREYDIDANNCNCDDFTAFVETEAPIENLYDGDVSTYVKIIADNGKTNIIFRNNQVFDSNLTSFRIYVDTSLDPFPKTVTLNTRGSTIWSSWKKCLSRNVFPTYTDWYELIIDEKCIIPKEGQIEIVFDTRDREDTAMYISEIDMTLNISGTIIDFRNAFEFPPEKYEESLERYSFNCAEKMIGGNCSEEWKKQWVGLELGKLAANCWSMGLEGERMPGTFSCYGGKILNLEDNLGTNSSEVIKIISEAMEKAEISERYTYANYLPKTKLTGENIDVSNYLSFVTDIAVSVIFPSLRERAIEYGYRPGSRYSMVYIDRHLLNVLLTGPPILTDKIVFY